MALRRLDRYIVSFFLWHFVLCLFAVVGLYVVIDTFAKLDEFAEQATFWAQLRWIVRYHAYQVPVLLGQFLPVVTLLAALISLARLARNNELNAIKAAGVSLQRTICPVLVAALGIGLLGALNQELLVPSLEHGILNTRLALKGEDVYDDLFVYDSDKDVTVWVRFLEAAVPGYEVSGVEVFPRKSGGAVGNEPTIRGAQGVWVDRWLFLWGGETKDSDGRWQPHTNSALTMERRTEDFAPPGPRKQDGSGNGLFRIPAQRGDKPLEVRFTRYIYHPRMYLLRGGQLTGALKNGASPPPTFISAAVWHKGKWIGHAQTYRQVTPRRREEIVYDGAPLPLTATPAELKKGTTDPMLKRFGELLKLARRFPAVRQKYLVVLHGRLAFPLASVVLLLVAIPLLFQQEGGKSTWGGMGLALLVSLCFYVVNYALQIIGQQPAGVFGNAPALAAWLPILIFAMAGAILTARMDT